MRWQVILMLVSCCDAGTLVAQYTGSAYPEKSLNQALIYDINTRSFEAARGRIDGSPFFDESYQLANLALADGKTLSNIQTKIDLLSKEVVIITANGMEARFYQGMVKEISITDTSANGTVLCTIKSGFPAVDKQDTNSFYQVICGGRCSFIRSLNMTLAEKINDISLRNEKYFKLTTTDYFFVNNEMKILPKNNAAVLLLLADKKPALTQYIQANKINCKYTEDITRLVNYYNSL